jgi:hypothetical protein
MTEGERGRVAGLGAGRGTPGEQRTPAGPKQEEGARTQFWGGRSGSGYGEAEGKITVKKIRSRENACVGDILLIERLGGTIFFLSGGREDFPPRGWDRLEKNAGQRSTAREKRGESARGEMRSAGIFFIFLFSFNKELQLFGSRSLATSKQSMRDIINGYTHDFLGS